jgi:3-oxoacyl-[acyl-carrier protein] reductase
MAAEQGVSEEVAKQRFMAGIPLRRHGTAEEVADLVVFLCSGRATYITGTNVTIDGGRSKSIV